MRRAIATEKGRFIAWFLREFSGQLEVLEATWVRIREIGGEVAAERWEEPASVRTASLCEEQGRAIVRVGGTSLCEE